MRDDLDILFMNQLGSGPGSGSFKISLPYIKNIYISACRDLNKNRFALVVRAVNLSQNTDIDGSLFTRVVGFFNDRKIISLINLADLIIFQSNYQKDVFLKAGCKVRNSVVIYNAADPIFWVDLPIYSECQKKLKLIATSFSMRSIKRHNLISDISELPDVEIDYYGQWPEGVPIKNVNLKGLATNFELSSKMKDYHYLYHPATRDACPNSVIEALCSGLPVIFNPENSGTGELVEAAGIEINEKDMRKIIDRAKAEIEIKRYQVLKVREKFRLKKIMKEYIECFEKLVVDSADHKI
jgi:glycosyltransferase involved in cell wall biosynthesis